uniref:NADH-ubiquinone oxidoreductase chain 3 n=1 Tax=Neelus murinus TaxID=1348065 RepID=A0A6B9IT39_9HEXA|nr:NADH dehydrogenase subunit 3 [Neelus murinus]
MIAMISILILIPLALVLINSTLAQKMKTDHEVMSPFECGFTPFSKARVPFSMRFFLIAIIFLIFDVEISLILPLPLVAKSPFNLLMSSLTLYFILILILGVLKEWKDGALEWSS